MRLKIKTLHLLASLAVLNVVLAVISLIVVGVLIHKNPELCFNYSCANSPLTKLEGEQVKDSTQAMIPASPQVSPLATSTVIAPKIKTSTITPVVYSSEQDWTEKQYIQALVTPYKTKFLLSIIIPPNTSINQNLIAEQNSLKSEAEYCETVSCGTGNMSEKIRAINKRGLVIYQEMQANTQKYNTEYINSKLTPAAQAFCSNSQIPTSYKDYCLSLFN